jgi:membrane protein YdbS with pleckstrin-like domain
MFCKKCGKKLDEEVKFCDSCGTQVDNSKKPITSKKFNFWKTYAFLTIGLSVFLTILFGFVGSYEEGFWEPFIGVVMLSALLGILVTFIIKWRKKGFAYENEPGELSEEEISRYKGLDGWLILLLIGLFITIAFQVYGVYESITLFSGGTVDVISNPASGVYIPGYTGALKFELIGEILFLAFAAYLIFLYFKKSKKFPKYYIVFLIASVIYVVLDYVIFSSLTVSSSEVKQVIDEALSEQGTGIGRSVLGAIVWGLYIAKSKRVKATFVEE